MKKYTLFKMRAKTINEIQEFQRGVPKSSLGAGGVQFGKLRYEAKQKMKKDWANFVENLLLGKTISGYFNQMFLKPDEETMIEGKGWGKYTFKVKEIIKNGEDDNGIFVRDEKAGYIIPMDEGRVFIEHES